MTFIPTPNPNYVIPYKNVRGNIVNTVSNKNLLVPFFTSKTQDGITIEFTEEGMKVSGNSTSRYQYFKIFDRELPPGNYVINGAEGASYNTYIVTVAKNGTNIGGVATNNFYFTLTEKSRITLNFYPYLTDYSSTKIFKYQLERGTNTTSYVAHKDQTASFTLEEGQFLGEEDSLEDNGIYNTWKEILLNGSENFELQPNKNNTFRLRLTQTSQNGLCTHYSANTVAEIGVKTGIYLINSIYVIITDNRYTTLTEFKTYLAEQYANNTPVKVQYKLQQQVITPYTSAQQEQYNAIKNLKSYKDLTYVESYSEELSPNLQIQYWKQNGDVEQLENAPLNIEQLENAPLNLEQLENTPLNIEQLENARLNLENIEQLENARLNLENIDSRIEMEDGENEESD